MKRFFLMLITTTLFLVSGVLLTTVSAEETTLVNCSISEGETYSFENIGNSSKDIINISKYSYIDYAIYYKDGSVKEYVPNAYNVSTISVPAGGKAVITSTKKTISVTFEDDFFWIEECENPVFNTVTTNIYESCEYKNVGNSSCDLLCTGNPYSNLYYYVIYDADGNVIDYGRTDSKSVEIPVKCSIKITQSSGKRTFYGLYNYLDAVEEEKPVMQCVTISAGETYCYRNNGNVDCKLLCNGNAYREWYYYVVYDADGNILEYERSDSGSIEVPAGAYVKITQLRGKRTFFSLSECFELEKEKEPVMKCVCLVAGETCIYTNSSNKSYSLLCPGNANYDYFSYVIYDMDGNIMQYERSDSDSIEVPAGYSIKITQHTGSRRFYSLRNMFEVENSTTAAMHNVLLEPGESCVYENTGDMSLEVFNSNNIDQRYDYVIYSSTGMAKESQLNTYARRIEIPAGYAVKIKQVKGKGVYRAIYENFSVEKTIASKNYKITSVDVEAVGNTIALESGSIDYAIYDSAGSLTDYGVLSENELIIPKGGYILSTVNASSTTFVHNDALNIAEYNEPVFETVYTEPEKIYKYINTASREMKVYKNGLLCDYIIYYSDGTIATYGVNSNEEYFTVPIGGSICITSDNYVTIKGLNACFDVEEVDNRLFETTSFCINETYQFENESLSDCDLFVSGEAYDYVIYAHDNSVHKEAVNADEEVITILSGAKIVITPRVSNVTVYSLKKAFTKISERSYPVMLRANVDYRASLEVRNSSSEDKKLYNLTKNYVDYAVYNSYSDVELAEEEVSPSEIKVPFGGKTEITARQSNAVFAGLYECFSDDNLSVKVTGITLSSNEIIIAKGKQSVLAATIFPNEAANKNIIWSSSNTSVATIAQTGKVTAKASGTAIITATTDDGGYTANCVVTVIDGTTATVSASSVSLNETSVTLTVRGTETLTATVLPVDATNKNVTWKSSNTNVASVINGVVTAKSAGTATITATTVDGGYKATCEVTVIESVEPMIYVSDVRARLGQTIEVTVSLKNNPGFGGLAYDIFYDNEVLSLVSYETELGKDICTSSAIDRYENKVNFQYASANEIEGDGKLVILTFTVKEDAPTGITEIKVVPEEETFFGYEGYEEIIYILLAKDGSVEVVEYTPGDINDDGNVNNRDAARILQHLAGWDVEYVEPALDVNGDGKVNNRDAARLLQYLAGWDVEIH